MPDQIKLARGVWRSAEQIETFEARAAALWTACPADTVITEISAARIYGLWLPPTRDDAPLDVILHPEIRPQPRRSGTRRREIRGRRRALDQCDIATVDGLPVTTPARTWFELARTFAMPDLIAAGDCALRFHCSRDEIAEVISRMRHHPGVVRARNALPYLNDRSRSRPESHMRWALMSYGLPEPDVNHPIFTDVGEWLAEPDLSYKDAKLAVEYNGADHAGTDRMRRDITREVDELGHDWLSVTAGPAQIFRRPDQFAALIARLHRERLHGRWRVR